jgi:hypothetical protein
MKMLPVVVLLGLVASSSQLLVASEPEEQSRQNAQPTKDDKRLREIIDAVREAEAIYCNLESVIRITREEGQRPDGAVLDVPLDEEVRHTIQQGDLFWFHSEQEQTLLTGEQVKSERFAAFDGKTTRSIDFGNCVNIHRGRHEPARLLPPHTWVMLPLEVNFPLSVYLQGTAAMAKHPKVRRFPVQRGSVFEFSRVETSFVQQERLDGMECVKLRCLCWHRDSDQPAVHYLWLATDCNYLCVKAQVYYGAKTEGQPGIESRALEVREVVPDVWLPFQVDAEFYFPAAQGVPERGVHSTISLIVENAEAGPSHELQRFRNVEIPADLPVFTIDREGYLENGPLRTSETELPDQRELERVIAAVREQEQRYEPFDATLQVAYHKYESEFTRVGAEILSYERDERTVVLPNRLYASRQEVSHSAAQVESSSANVAAWDGKWLRELTRVDHPAQQHTGAGLHKGDAEGVYAFRAHTALFDDGRIRSRKLSDCLSSDWYDLHNKYPQKVEYWGTEVVDGLKCEKLRVGILHGNEAESHVFFFIWLATERNYLPIRREWYELGWSKRLPTGTASVLEWREIADGLWLPLHVVDLAYRKFNHEGICEGRIIINWRLDGRFEAFSLQPDVPDDFFELQVPAGTTVNVTNERGQGIGQFLQERDGLVTISDEKWRIMAASASADEQERKEKQEALDAMVGKPVPEFSEATWLNAPMFKPKSLSGKVLLVDFWAEWYAPCRQDLRILSGRRDLADAGIMVIGVHPTGSRMQDIERVLKESHVDYPIYVDVAQLDSQHPWGAFFDRCAARELPHAIVVDRQGRIVADGGLEKMILKARELVEK